MVSLGFNIFFGSIGIAFTIIIILLMASLVFSLLIVLFTLLGDATSLSDGFCKDVIQLTKSTIKFFNPIIVFRYLKQMRDNQSSGGMMAAILVFMGYSIIILIFFSIARDIVLPLFN